MGSLQLSGIRSAVALRRTAEGVMEIRARSPIDGLYGLGWAVGRDRGAQIFAMRALGQGRACELLRDTPALLGLDSTFRRLGFARDARAHIGALPRDELALVEAYTRGVNAAWRRHPPKILLRRLSRPEPLTPADVLLFVKLSAYTGLAEGQRIVELFLTEAVRRGAPRPHLEQLFHTLDALDVRLLKGVGEIPDAYPGFRLQAPLALSGGSNAWVVSGRKTASGHPLLANDPHLEVNRLPAVLYEASLSIDGAWTKGAMVPGIPGFLSGRSSELAWGVTYSAADTSDFFVERCEQGRRLYGGHSEPFEAHHEILHRRRHEDVQLTVHSGPHGVLEGDPRERGDHLSWLWAGMGDGGLGTLQAVLRLPRCRTVREAQSTMRGADIPTLHMVFADSGGDIAYQLAGRIPRRRQGWSGLAPVAGWDPLNDWKGWLDPETEQPSRINPPGGTIVITNTAQRCPGGPRLSTLHLPHDRHRRIRELLERSSPLQLSDMQDMQYDVLSTQARRFLPDYLPMLPPGPERRLLEAWDCRYSADSEAATLFENLHRAVVDEVFGAVLGRPWFHRLMGRTGLYASLIGLFDTVLSLGDSLWLPRARRRRRLSVALATGMRHPHPPWGSRNAITLGNLFLGDGRISRWLGFAKGPVALLGNHATIHQGVRYRAGNRVSTSAPCYHMVTDLGDSRLYTNLPGGASESRLSRYYANDLRRWLHGGYKGL